MFPAGAGSVTTAVSNRCAMLVAGNGVPAKVGGRGSFLPPCSEVGVSEMGQPLVIEGVGETTVVPRASEYHVLLSSLGSTPVAMLRVSSKQVDGFLN